MKIKFFVLCLLCSLFLCINAQAAVIFQDNFDSSANWTVTQPIAGGNQCWSDCNIPGSWTGYYNSGSKCIGASGVPGNNNLYINVAGYPTESTTCRGGSGKCFTHWMESCLQPPQFDDADGMLGIDLGAEYEDVYVRIYIRFDSAFELDPAGMFKLFHAQHWAGSATPWNYFERDTNNQPVAAGGIANYGGILFLYSSARCFTTYNCYGDINWRLGTTAWAYANGGVFDGNWHSIEMRYKRNSAIGVANGLIEAWFDGVKKPYESGYAGNAIPFTNSGTDLRGFRFISVGGNNTAWNYGCTNMTACEQWWAIDDVVISTTYIGPDGAPNPPPQVPVNLRIAQ
jgi:chitinase